MTAGAHGSPAPPGGIDGSAGSGYTRGIIAAHENFATPGRAMEQVPRSLTGRLLLVANLGAATLAAATCVVGFVRPSAVGVDLGALPGEAGRMLHLPLDTGMARAVFLASLLLLVLDLYWLVRRAPAPPPRTHVVSETPTGPVRVSREALEAGLRVAGEALPEITRLRVVVDPALARRIVVRSYFQCAEGTSNLNASQRLRASLRERFAEMVRLPDGVRAEFELEFQGFLGKLARRGAEARAALEPEPPPFTGPQYPIDEDGSG